MEIFDCKLFEKKVRFQMLDAQIDFQKGFRGEKIMELLTDIMDMFTRHGHEAGKDPRASITQSTIDDLDKIKKRIKDEMTQNQNNVILNHNLRFN